MRRPLVTAMAATALAASLTSCSFLGEASPAGDTKTASSNVEAGENNKAEEEVSSDLTAIFDGVTKSMQSAQSVTISVPMEFEGKLMDATMELHRGTKDFEMVLKSEKTGSLTMKKIGEDTWSTGDDLFWKSQIGERADEAALKRLRGKWIKLPPEQGDDGPGFDFDGMMSEMKLDDLSLLDKLRTKIEEIDYDGGKSYKLTDRIDDEDVYFIISADGQYTLQEIKIPEDKELKGPLKFTLWNETKKPVAPKPENVLSL